MVKKRPGSMKGQTKLGAASKRSARRRAVRQRNGLSSSRVIIHPAMRSSWDSRRSPASNLSRVGLKASVNSLGKATMRKQYEIESHDVLPQLEAEAAVPERGPNRVVHPGERMALEKMVQKWGDDWQRMARDLKLNYLQWTPRQLENKVLRMRQIIGEQELGSG